MSFGSSGFGGFGQNTSNNQSGGFGGFGSPNTNTSGFGSNNAGGFGTNNSSGGLFGSNSNNASGGFGTTAGGFGSNTATSGFGTKTGFGSTGNSGGGLFGSTTATTTPSSFGGFGGANNNTTSPFGGGNASGGSGLFGGGNTNKTGFGSTNNTGSSLFGSGGGTGGFGSAGFGASTNPGLSGGVGDPPGTAVTPFQAHSEKEQNSTGTNSFQNILFQEPYKKWSAEELRLADYAQGRRHGNASGAGVFGVSSGFGGGFGSSNQQTTTAFGPNSNAGIGGGLFGSNNTTSSTASGFGGFGANTNTTNTGGGLFGGGNKPSGGLFGSTSQPQQSGGLFGSGTSTGAGTGTAFGSNTNTGGTFGQTSNTGGGLFGNNQNQQKPAGTGFSFGNTTNTATNNTTSAFGSQSNNAFGSTTNNASSGLFGNNANASSGGLFGGSNNNQQQQQQQQNTGFGTSFGQQPQNQQSGGGLFGNNQQKPAGTGLFGGSSNTNTTSGGLFGNTSSNTQQQQGGGLFGSNTNNPSSGGLFGNKTSTGGLFGSNTQSGTGGLFGNTNQNQQQSTGGGLFGNSNNNQMQRPGGIFGGSTTNQTSGGGLFGSQAGQGQTGGLFGSTTNQQAQNTLGSSLLGNQQQAPNNQNQSLTTSLSDISAFGSASLFAGVGGNETPNPGPLATPLNNGTKPRRNSILPIYKMGPSSSRYATPQKRGFGFSYSTYGTPSASPASSISSTPGARGRSVFASSANGSLGKSVSVNNLRKSFNTDDSILAPGAFSASSSRWFGSTGSKKLIINRDLRSDLFSTPQRDKQIVDPNTSSRKLSKRVSFDTSNVDSEGAPVRGALPAPVRETNGSVADETPRQNRPQITNQSASPADQHVSGTELARVNEDEASVTPSNSLVSSPSNPPGEYHIHPSLEELQSMNRVQRQTVPNFTVSRENIGKIEFKVPVDVSNIDLEKLCGEIIQLEPRSATVYPDQHVKPPQGKGLNVPAKITLEQSYPRNPRERSSKKLEKHIERLARIPDTTFESYDKQTGVWVFSVEHFTTYGLDESDEDSDDEVEIPPTVMGPESTMSQPMNRARPGASVGNDSADFRQRGNIPGAFDRQVSMYEEVDDEPEQSFLGVSSADSAPNNVMLSLEQEQLDDIGEEYDMSEDEDMARSSPGQHLAAELSDTSSEGGQESKRGTPGGILRARMRATKDSMAPVELEVADGDDWMEMLRKTVSPMKRDRQFLKEANESPLRQADMLIDLGKNEDGQVMSSVWKKSAARMNGHVTSGEKNLDSGRGFATSIDLMNSLFEKPKLQAPNLSAANSSKGFPKWPYERQYKTLIVDESEQAFHNASRPSWGPDETLILTRPLDASRNSRQTIRDAPGILAFQKLRIPAETQEVLLARFSTETSKKVLDLQEKFTRVRVVDGVPLAELQAPSLKDLFHPENSNDPVSFYERRVWELASILFDPSESMTSPEAEHLSRKGRLSQFWADLVEQPSVTATGLARSSEEKAVACLSGHRVLDACKHLMDGKNYHLATLVSLVGTDDGAKSDIKEQVRAWHDAKTLSEFSEPIRTIYELLSGNVCICQGMKAVPVQDRLGSFVISRKFGLNWKQSFGLRLWYAISKQDDIASAVRLFKDDIAQDREDTPRPWYVEQGILPLWNDAAIDERQDILWGLLQLYADDVVGLEEVLRPENSQLSPFDMRLCWQMGLALVSTGKVANDTRRQERADAATIGYAAQLSSAGEWLKAVFVLLHLNDATVRTKAIQEQLCRHAGKIGSETSSVFGILTEKYRIPAAWVWEAIALYMRSVTQDAAAEVQSLLRAGQPVEAHRVLIQQVAPQAIIERDYGQLARLLALFESSQRLISQWSLGGEIYNDFLALLRSKERGEAISRELLEKLLAGLQAMSEDGSDSDVVRYAAASDMADETAKQILRMAKTKQGTDLRWKVLSLPLTQDRLLAYSVGLGLDHYREVMAR